jgi:hypothetical protein
MKLIFECETELGRCELERVNAQLGMDTGEWIALAYTTAATTSSKGMLRIEQRCYLRSTESTQEIQAQNWVKPEMTLEPVLTCEKKTVEIVRRLHERFLENARHELAKHSLITAPRTPEEAPAHPCSAA